MALEVGLRERWRFLGKGSTAMDRGTPGRVEPRASGLAGAGGKVVEITTRTVVGRHARGPWGATGRGAGLAWREGGRRAVLGLTWPPGDGASASDKTLLARSGEMDWGRVGACSSGPRGVTRQGEFPPFRR